MVRIAKLVGAFAFCALHATAWAEDMATRADTITQDGETLTVVNFEFASCGGECQVAMLLCNGSGSIALELSDVEAKSAAKAIVKQTQQIVVKVGTYTVDYDILEMRFQEMTGSWWLRATNNREGGAKLASAIATSKSVVATVGGQKIALPVDATVKAWARACK